MHLVLPYGTDRLVYFEEYWYVTNAIAQEKQIKNWRRDKKVNLITSTNSQWRDLSDWAGYRDSSARPQPVAVLGLRTHSE